jgi:hypothetical protein
MDSPCRKQVPWMRTENARHRKLEAHPMPSDRIEHSLEQRARERIREGRLPCTTHYRTWGGRGSNEPCALCDMIIQADEVQYEIEAGVGAPGQLYRFHFGCHDAWQYACAQEE